MPTYSEIVYNFTFDETANRTADETADRTADRTADETTDETTDETADETTDRTTDETTDHSSISFVPIIRVNPDFQRNRLICKFASLLKILFIRKFNKDVRNHNRQTGILL